MSGIEPLDADHTAAPSPLGTPAQPERLSEDLRYLVGIQQKAIAVLEAEVLLLRTTVADIDRRLVRAERALS